MATAFPAVKPKSDLSNHYVMEYVVRVSKFYFVSGLYIRNNAFTLTSFC